MGSSPCLPNIGGLWSVMVSGCLGVPCTGEVGAQGSAAVGFGEADETPENCSTAVSLF